MHPAKTFCSYNPHVSHLLWAPTRRTVGVSGTCLSYKGSLGEKEEGVCIAEKEDG